MHFFETKKNERIKGTLDAVTNLQYAIADNLYGV
jgi:hypothetical protein